MLADDEARVARRLERCRVPAARGQLVRARALVRCAPCEPRRQPRASLSCVRAIIHRRVAVDAARVPRRREPAERLDCPRSIVASVALDLQLVGARPVDRALEILIPRLLGRLARRGLEQRPQAVEQPRLAEVNAG